MPGLKGLKNVVSIAELSNTSLHWLLTGEGPKGIVPADQEILSRFNIHELQAIKQLAADAKIDVADVVHRLTTEALLARGLRIGQPKPRYMYLDHAPADAERVSIDLKGVITDGGALILFETAKQVLVPYRYKKPAFYNGEELHRNFVYALAVATDNFQDQGINAGDLIICTAHWMFHAMGQPVVALTDDESKVIIGWYYDDPLSPYQYMFAPLKGAHPVIYKKQAHFSLFGLILGIDRSASAAIEVEDVEFEEVPESNVSLIDEAASKSSRSRKRKEG